MQLKFFGQARKFWWRGRTTRLRDRKIARDKDNPHPSLQLYLIGVWTRTRRQVSGSELDSKRSLKEPRVYERQEPSSTFYTEQNRSSLISRLEKLEEDVRGELRGQGFEEHRIHVERALNMRFEGTDTALMVLPEKTDGDGKEDFEAAFKRAYKSEFGFLLETKTIIVDDIKVGCWPYTFLWRDLNAKKGSRNRKDV